MNHFRFLYLTTTAAISGCLFGSFTNKLKHNFQVNAQPCKCSQQNIVDTEPPEEKPRIYPGSANVQSWLHPPGSPEWIQAVYTPGEFEKLWIPYENGGNIFPHYQIPTRAVLEYKDFLICYDNDTKTPVWVLEDMTVEGLKTKVKNTNNIPHNDERVPEELQASQHDYVEVAHRIKPLRLASLCFHKHLIKDSYVYTTLAPAVVDEDRACRAGRTVWDEIVNYVYHLYIIEDYDEVFVLSGSLFLSRNDEVDGKMYRNYEVFGKKKIGVPTHFFHVILSVKKGKIRLECFKFENKVQDRYILDLRKFSVKREELEREAGFRIFREIKRRKISYNNQMAVKYTW
uniref:Uncharacterized protein n=1 Tax=Strigamia maritima TaxID=126957 RepID=T1JII0_STRMM